MDLSIFDTIKEIFDNICNFLFGTYLGVALLFFGFIIIAFIIAAILEKRTKKIYVDHGDNTKNYDEDKD